MPSRLRAVRTLFSLRVKSPTAAWPFRSSGTAHSPSLRRPLVRNCPIGWPPISMAPGALATSPSSASSSSFWPLPATPATPKISPLRTEKLMSSSEVPK